MTADELINTAIIETVPQLYSASGGPYSHTNAFGTHTVTKYTHRALTPNLNDYLQTCTTNAAQLRLTNPLYEEVEFERVQQFCASIWLEKQTGIQSWPRIFDYFSKLQKRTIENTSISKTIVIDRNYDTTFHTGVDISDEAHNKVIDWVASSQYSYLRVTDNLKLISYESLRYSQIPDPNSYRFLPSFLMPIASQLAFPKRRILGPRDPIIADVLVTSNQRGDLIITDKNQILASRRKGKWTVYDPPTIKNTIHDCIKEGVRIPNTWDSYGIACCLFQVLFDMSFKRHGGLLIVDSDINAFRTFTSGGVFRRPRTGLDELLPLTSLNTTRPDQTDIRRLLELSSIDGAILINSTGSVEGFGVMVNPQPGGGRVYGARSTAARAAVAAGAVAFKVSSDGEISVFFQTRGSTAQSIHEIKFL